MDEDEIQENVDAVMKEVHESDAFSPKTASKADTRAFLLGIIEECKSELEALGGDDDDEEEYE